ncbi:MAG: hypothetical protein A3G41_07625 [Elusimicrobia bacterium RIFCSPLOWO2_12_FULL_59_9]|nr:MAG: hypothetical protein A3G41_07625 [Elusimicrobia bacterium RIFCSPLOWO2_12_FULL_59_9]
MPKGFNSLVKERSADGVELVTLSGHGGKLRLSVAPALGGEIHSLRRLWRGRWIELLYRGKGSAEQPWRGGAPWLFPAVGRSFAPRRPARQGSGRPKKEPGFWSLAGVSYPMPIHGFVRNQVWRRSAASGVFGFEARADDATRVFYPFDYRFQARYFLEAKGLRAEATVAAGINNREAMPFSMGNHIAFVLPLAPGADAGACRVRTPARENRLLSPAGLLTGATRPANYRRGVSLREAPELNNCALGGFGPGEAWAEIVDPASFGVRVRQREILSPGAAPKAAPEYFCFVFYGDERRGFLCPEPWVGVPNSLNDRQGVVLLKPGTEFRWEMTVEFF